MKYLRSSRVEISIGAKWGPDKFALFLVGI